MFVGKVTYVRRQSKLTPLAKSADFVKYSVYFCMKWHLTDASFSI